jgi:hypothetical protein
VGNHTAKAKKQNCIDGLVRPSILSEIVQLMNEALTPKFKQREVT